MGEPTARNRAADLTSADVEFVRHLPTDTVHVMVPPQLREAWWERYRARGINAELWPVDPPELHVMTVLVMSPMPCLCGHLGVRLRDEGADTFDDEQLCRSCYRAWPGDSALLFEHGRPGDDTGGHR